MHLTNTYRVVQPVNVQHYSFSPLVVGSQEEMGFTLAGGGRRLGLFRFFFTG